MEFDNFVPSNFYLYIERLDGKSRERERERDFINRIKKKKKILIIVAYYPSIHRQLQNCKIFPRDLQFAKFTNFTTVKDQKGNRAMASYKL